MMKPFIGMQSGAAGGYMRSAGFVLLGTHRALRIERKPPILPYLPSATDFNQRHVLDTSIDLVRNKIHIIQAHWPVCNRLENVWPKPALT